MRLMIGSARMINPIADGIVSSMTSRKRMRKRAAKFRGVTERGAARNQRQRHGRDRDSEKAERQLHQPKRDVEPGHRPIAETRKRNRCSPPRLPARRWPRSSPAPSARDRAHAGIAPIEVGPETKSDARERWKLHEQLQKTADERAERQANQRATAEMRIEQPAKSDAADDRAEIEKTRSHRGHAENILRIQHSHHERGERDEENERKHDPREQDRELRFVRSEPGREHVMSAGAKMIPSNVTALMKTTVRVATLLASRQADWSPSVAMRRENVVTNAVESAPSAKRSRNMFGARNAVRNASMFLLAPKSEAKTTSRSSPSTRLQRIAMPTTPVARVLTRLFGLSFAVTDAKNSGVANYESEINLGQCSCRSSAPESVDKRRR